MIDADYSEAGCRYLVAAMLKQAVQDVASKSDRHAFDALRFLRAHSTASLCRHMGISRLELSRLADRLEDERETAHARQ